jgi:hypothetical protein
MQTFEIGEPRQLTSTWWDSKGDGIEPSAITLTVTHPDGTTTVFTKLASDLTQGATVADWYRWYTPNALGVWRYNFVGTVNAMTVEQGGVFLVGEGTSTSPTGPCEPWTTWEDVLACGPDSLVDVSPEQAEYAIDVASEILFSLSGRVYPGICSVTRSICTAPRCCASPTCNGCEPMQACAIDLGTVFPVRGAWDVYALGVLLAPTSYRVHDWRYLLRVDGEVWPWVTLSVTNPDPNALRASWAYGRMPPVGGQNAARMFATEIAKLCVGDKSCQIPQRVTSVSREGTTYTILDSMKMISEGKTGLALVDLWLVSDKQGRKARPGFFSPGGPSTRLIA